MCEADWRCLTPALRYRHKIKKQEAEPFFFTSRPGSYLVKEEQQQQLSQKVETRRRENISRYFLSPRSTQFGLKVFSWQVPFASLQWAEFSVEFIFFFQRKKKPAVFSILINQSQQSFRLTLSIRQAQFFCA